MFSFIDSLNSGLNRTVESLVQQRIRIGIWLCVIGFLLVVTSVSLNIGFVSFDGVLKNGTNVFGGNSVTPNIDLLPTKQVGFLAALNWSLFCVILAPFIVYFALCTLRAFETTLSELCKAGMMRDAQFSRIEYGYLSEKWAGHIRKNRLLFAFVFLAVFGFVMNDWWSVVGNPILNAESIRTMISDPTMEYDWSVASIFADTTINSYALLIFGFIAYFIFAGFVPASVIAVSLCTVYYMLFITTLRVNEAASENDAIKFAAVPTSSPKDRHFGFKIFSDLFHNFLIMSLLILIGLWFMSVQNTYLRDVNSTDIYGFVLGEYNQYSALASGQVSVGEFFQWFIKPAPHISYNTQVMLSALLFPFVSLVSVLGCWFTLHYKAKQAQEFSMQHTGIISEEFGINEDIFAERLQYGMDVWPVGWITSNKLLSIMFFLFMSLVSYRLIVVALGLMGGIGVLGALKSFMSK